MMPGISLCMITKDEQEFLEQCINSVKSAVDEIIVVDTGSTDKTKEIAKKLGAKVFDFEFNDDFSEAKNFCISKASHEYILSLDADEAVSEEDAARIKEIIKENADGFKFKIRNYFKAGIKTPAALNDSYEESKNYAGWHEAELIRLFKNKKDIYFTNIIHESVADSIRKLNGKIKPADIVIHHFGFAVKQRSENKTKKYIQMQEKQIKLTPNNPKPYYELGAIYLGQDNCEKAVELFEKARQLLKEDDILLIHKYLYHDLGRAYLKLKNLEKARHVFEKAQDIDQNNYSTQFFLGLICDEQEDYPNAVRHYEISIKLNPQNPSAYCNLGIIYIKQKHYNKAYEILSKAYELEPGKELAQTLKSLQKNLGKKPDITYRNV